MTQSLKILSIDEKPKEPKTFYAVTGLYFYNNSVIDKALRCKPSLRGELEISSINQEFLKEKKLKLKILGRGTAWLDTGTQEAMNNASNFIKSVEDRQSLKISCLEEIAFRRGFIDRGQLEEISKDFPNDYGEYLKRIIV